MKFIVYFLFSHFKWHLLLMFLFVLLGQGLESLEPFALKWLLDSGMKGSVVVPEYYIAPLLLLCVLRLSSLLILRGNQLVDSHFNPRCKALMQKTLYEKLLQQPLAYFYARSTGTLGHLISECSRITLLLLDIFVVDVLRGIVLLTGAITVLGMLELRLSFLLLVWAIFHVTVSCHLSLICARYSRTAADFSSRSFGWIVDSINNIEVLKDYGAEHDELDKLNKAQQDDIKYNIRLKLFTTWTRIFQSISVSLLFSCLLFACLYFREGQHDMASSFALVASISTMISFQFWNISNRLVVVVENVGILNKAVETLLISPPPLSGEEIELKNKVNCSIEFKNVCFGYDENVPVLSALSFNIHAGERVALVGPSGSGKTTITKLLQRHTDGWQGDILVNGINIATIAVKSLRDAITIVNQNPALFHRSVLDNIQYGAKHSSLKEVQAAACLAFAHEFISKRPDGYQTIVGERGSQFSGGQKQRIALSRALLKRSPILILDEATSALDIDTEEAIQSAINDASGNKTVIVIAHRLSTISMMDRILYIDGGKVVESGTHRELMSLKGKYHRLWDIQVRRRQQTENADLYSEDSLSMSNNISG